VRRSVTGEKLDSRAYWRAHLRVIALLLAIWALVGILSSIVFVDWLNRFSLGGYPLGFWFAQQGSIYVFIVLIFVYARWMERIERGGGKRRR
jgi:putative solute:sodium symporter small subunit